MGELGDGTTSSRLTPVLVAGGHRFRQVSSGQHLTCGATTSDQAYCWGWNRFGQVGDSSRAPLRLAPSRVAGTLRFHQVDAGSNFACGVTTNDRAFCWGNGRVGQIGDGKTQLRFWPRAVASGVKFRRVSAGGLHACGESREDRTYCWGYNLYHGELGGGTTATRLTPIPVIGVLRFSQVSAGSSHTCGRTPGAIAYCWGNNQQGELGDGTSTSRSLTPVPVADDD